MTLSASVPKLLKLETLGRRQAYFIVAINWLAVLFACTFGAFEYDLRVDPLELVAQQSGEFSYRCVVDGFSPASRFVLANVRVELDSANKVPPMFAARVNALDDASQWVTLLSGNMSSVLQIDEALCGAANGTGACRVGAVYWDDDVLYSTYEFAVEFAAADRTQVRDVAFLVTRHSATFTLVELSLVMTLCFVTTVFFLYWIVLWQRSRKLLPEQRWMPFLLLTLLGGQRPLFAVSALLPYSFAWATAAGVLQVLSYGVAATYVLLLLDGLSYRTREYPWSFYLPKALFGGVLIGAGVTWSVLDRRDLAVRFENAPIVALLVIGFAIATLGCIALWLVWVVHAFLRTRYRLARVPFVANRWRQLSFRFVSVISTTFFLFVLVTLIINVVNQTNFAGTTLVSQLNAIQIEATYMWISTLVLVSTYCYSIAFVYMPPSANWLCHHDDDLLASSALLAPAAFAIKRRGAGGRFCVEDAAVCLEIAYQAYYDESPEQRTASGFGVMDRERIERWGHTIAEFISETENDTHVIVTRSAGVIVVAMRGTASFENAMTDLKMSMVLLPKPQHESVFPEPRVHKGFFIAFTYVWPRILGAVRAAEKAARAAGHRDVEVMCCGHSLGGALATLAALYLRWSLPADVAIQMISFGSPRVGSYSFARLYDRCVPHSWRVVCDRDIVASLPKFGFMYKHAGTEVMIDRRGNIIADQSYVERFFQPPRRSFRDHLLEHYRRSFLAALSRHGAARSTIAKRMAADGDDDIVHDALRSMQFDEAGFLLDPGESDSDDSSESDEESGKRSLVKAREPTSAQPTTTILGPTQVERTPVQSPVRGGAFPHGLDHDDDHDHDDDDDDDDADEVVQRAPAPPVSAAAAASISRIASATANADADVEAAPLLGKRGNNVVLM
jgi:pimeloyl-ACP methyl ester carboxylesterase